jgi:Bacterial membrane protein YfhO
MPDAGERPALPSGAIWLGALVVGVWLQWHFRMLEPGQPLVVLVSGDLFHYFMPAYDYAAERMRELAVPLWNPYQAAGQPFLATLQPGVFYPARLLLLLLDVPAAMGASALAHVLLVFVGTWALCRSLGARPGGATAGAVAFGATFGLTNLYWPSYLEAGAWLPVAALCLVRVARAPGWGAVALLGLASAMPILAGGYQVTIYVAYALIVFGLALLADRSRCADPIRAAGRMALGAALGVGTAAPQLLPTLAWSGELWRRAAPLSDVQMDPFWGFMPRLWFVKSTFVRGPGFFQPYYLSIPVGVLALVGFVRAGRLGLVLGAGAIGFYLLSLGPGTPWFFVYRLLPGLAMYRFPARLFVIVAFLSAVGVGFGVSALAHLMARWGRAPALAVEAAAVAAIAIALVAPIRVQTLLPWTAPAKALRLPPALRAELDRLADGARVVLPSDAVAPGLAVRGGTRERIRVVDDYEPLSSSRLAEYLYAVAGEASPPQDAVRPFIGTLPAKPIARLDLLDLLDVRAIVTRAGPATAGPLATLPRTRAADLTIYANPGALPRAYLVGRVRFVGDRAAALAALDDAAVTGGAAAVVVGAPGPGEEALVAAPAGRAGTAEIVVDGPERVVVSVDAPRPALLVLADSFAPGWRVAVDGEERPLREANHYVRGVPVPPGAHRVEFTYTAPGFRAGLGLAAIAWAGLAAIALLAGRRRAEGGG